MIESQQGDEENNFSCGHKVSTSVDKKPRRGCS